RVEGNLGMIWLAKADYRQANVCFSLVVAGTQSESWEHVLSIVTARRGLAEVYLAQEQYNEAWHQANEAENLAEGRKLMLSLAETSLTKAHIAELDPSTPGAATYFRDQGRQKLREYGNPIILARTLMSEARYQCQRGNRGEATDLALEARDHFVKLAMDIEVQISEEFIIEMYENR
ncbi:MAG TPA: hypothetical protein VJZ27_14750, partial [Aggregatilineales bacterium]|nr:hypothetical protein [Aggregatilineales bacterium]